MFTTYIKDGMLKTELPVNATVVITDVWGREASGQPGKMFDVSMIAKEGDTVQDALDTLGVTYGNMCADHDLEPREVYGYEGCVRITGLLYKIMLGT